MNNNHLKIVTDNASIKPQIQQAMSNKSSSSGAVTPTSDFVDDSGVSEDNASSANSGSEQGSNNVYRNVRITPKSFATTSRERDSETIDNEDIDDANNNTIQKNRTSQNQAPPTPSIIHLSPGGSTVIELKTMSSASPKSNVTPNTMSPLCNSNAVIVSSSNGMTNVIKTVSTQQSSTQHTSTTSSPHTHFHKKYIKAMNALNGSNTETTTVTVSTSNPIINSSQEAQISSPSTVVSINTPSTTIYTIPMKAEYRYGIYNNFIFFLRLEIHTISMASPIFFSLFFLIFYCFCI